jgi:D-amino-acid dehydrogenase
LNQNSRKKTKSGKDLDPASPDGVPYIGAAPGYQNVWFGTGHGMMGISMAPATGKILTDLHQGHASTMDLKAFEVGKVLKKEYKCFSLEKMQVKKSHN